VSGPAEFTTNLALPQNYLRKKENMSQQRFLEKEQTLSKESVVVTGNGTYDSHYPQPTWRVQDASSNRSWTVCAAARYLGRNHLVFTKYGGGKNVPPQVELRAKGFVGPAGVLYAERLEFLENPDPVNLPQTWRHRKST